MSAISKAEGGDGWSRFTITRSGDEVMVLVHSKAEKVDYGAPVGLLPKILLDETIRDETGRRALDRALSVCAEYAHRMAS